MSFGETFNIGGLVASDPPSSSLITPSVDVSRTSGVAPLAIHFDASATTSGWTSRPFHDLEYRYNFGDEAVSTWTYGAQPGVLLKNIAYGSTAAHLYESAGTYNPSVTIRYRLVDGSYDSTTYSLPSVTVTAADTEWATTKTVSYSTSTDHTGAPFGCTQVSNVTDLSASFSANKGSGNKRHLLRAGQTFAISSTIAIDVGGPSYFGKFGSGADPIINSTLAGTVFGLSSSGTPTGVSDWRFEDIQVDCNGTGNSCGFGGNGSCSDILLNRMYLTRCGTSIQLSGSTLDSLNASVPFTHAMWDKFFVMNTTSFDLQVSASGPNAMFVNCRRLHVMGCFVDNQTHGEHGIRMQLYDRGTVQHNTVQGIAPAKANLTIRGIEFAGSNTVPAGEYSQKIMVSDNKFVGGDSVGMIGLGPQNGTNDERARNIIYESNLFLATSSITQLIVIAQPDITVRSNLFNIPAGAGGGTCITISPSGVVPVPDRCHIYNNSIYYGGSSASTWSALSVTANNETSPFDQDMPDSVFEYRNNIVYAPNGLGDWVRPFRNENGSLATTNQSNNTLIVTNTNDTTTSPLFATNPPVLPAHFIPASGSYANGSGFTTIPVCSDFYRTNTQTTPDMGAIVI